MDDRDALDPADALGDALGQRQGAAALLSGCVSSSVVKPPDAPERLRPPANQVLAFETLATGVQIYECNASKDVPTRFEWVFKAPEADLFDSAGKKIGTHYAGPTWESTDGSKVVGEVKAKQDDPAGPTRTRHRQRRSRRRTTRHGRRQ